MSLKRTAVLMAASHSNQLHSSSNNSAWSSLASGNTSPSSNASDFYTATNLNHNNNKSYNNQGMRVSRPGVGGFHGNVNILLGGAMLTVVTTIVCLICYCCHRKIKMRASTSSLYRQQRWLDNDPNMEIYSVEQYFDTSGMYVETDNMPTMVNTNEPPPSYECVMALDEVISRKRKNLYTFKVYHHHHHHPGHDFKDCVMGIGNENPNSTTDTPQVSLDETNCDMRSPSSAASLCNCNCSINQSFTTTANLCANCSNVIDNADNMNNNSNNITCTATLIAGSNPMHELCLQPLHMPMASEIDALNDQLNNNQTISIASPSTSSSTNYASCSTTQSGVELQTSCDADEINGNGGECSNMDTINGNGLVRVDMSQIIDQTGLPTYEAALQLKSSGYV